MGKFESLFYKTNTCLQKESAKWRTCVLTCLACSHALRARVLDVLVCSINLACLACFIKMTCLVCFKKWRVCRASKIGVFDMLHKMACVKLLNCFLDVYSDGALVNCRFWMRSEVLDGRKKICKPIFTIFVFVLNLKFFVWIQIFIHIYRIQKQISWLPSINPKFSLPVSSNKVKNSWSVKEVLIFSTNRMTKLNKSSILW